MMGQCFFGGAGREEDIDQFARVIDQFPTVIDQFVEDIDHFPTVNDHFPSYIVIL